MKIVSMKMRETATRLIDFDDGVVVRLQRRLGQNTDITDPYLLVDMQSYSLYCTSRDLTQSPTNGAGKRVVINLATGRLSCIDNAREATKIKAEVHTS